MRDIPAGGKFLCIDGLVLLSSGSNVLDDIGRLSSCSVLDAEVKS